MLIIVTVATFESLTLNILTPIVCLPYTPTDSRLILIIIPSSFINNASSSPFTAFKTICFPVFSVNLIEAIEIAKDSEFVKSVLPQKTIDNYINDKMEEWNIYSSVTDKFRAEKQLYFDKL